MKQINPPVEILDGEEWTVSDVPPTRSRCSRLEHTLEAPLDDAASNRAIRAHEYCHAKFSPVRIPVKKIAAANVSLQEFRAAEEFRVNSLGRAKGIDFSAMHLDEDAKNAPWFNFSEALNSLLATYGTGRYKDILERLRPNVVTKAHPIVEEIARTYTASKCKKPAVSIAIAQAIHKAAEDKKKEDRGKTAKDDSGKDNSGEDKTDDSESTKSESKREQRRREKNIRDEAKRESKRRKPRTRKPRTREDNNEDDNKTETPPPTPGVSYRADSSLREEELKRLARRTARELVMPPSMRTNQWGKMTIIPQELAAPRDKKMLRRGIAASDSGDIPTKFYREASDGYIFGTRAKRLGGTVLIDNSGSMSLEDDDIRKILKVTRGALVAYYHGTEKNEGHLHIVGKDGRMTNRLYCPGRANIIDGPALRWLCKQRKPRIWICDGMVTGIGDEMAENLTQDAARIVQDGNIIRAPHIDQALELLKRFAR